jgi:hypothetical protein
MKTLKYLTVLGLFVAGSLAVEAAEVQTVQSKRYVMPAGDFSVRGKNRIELPRRVPIGDDALIRLKKQRGGGEDATTVPPKGSDEGRPLNRNCNVNVATGFAPSDIHGASGTNRLVVVTNVDIGIYKKKNNCPLVSRVPLRTFFGAFGIPASQTLFDPRAIWDVRSNRFIVTAESRDSGNNDQFQYFAVSANAKATSWHLYRFTLSQGAAFFCKQAVTSFWDYPSVGVSNTRIFITANDFGAATTGAILSINKTPTLSGGGTTGACFANQPFNIQPPIVTDASTTSVFLSPGSGASSSIVRRDIVAGASPAADSLFVRPSFAIAAWTAPPGAVQNNGQRLDSLDGRFQSATTQLGSTLFNIHAVNVGGRSLIRWYRLAFAVGSSTVNNTVTFQTSATDHVFNPSITSQSSAAGDTAFITASRTDPVNANPSGFAAHLQFHGPNNNSAGWVFNVVGTSTTQVATDGLGNTCNTSPRGECRWGDYSATTLDPNTAAKDAWGFNQLMNGTNQFNWFTKAGRSKL